MLVSLYVYGDMQSFTALSAAGKAVSHSDRLGMIALLLAHGADVNDVSRTKVLWLGSDT